MKRKICIILVILILFSIIMCINRVYATDSIVDKLDKMQSVTTPDITGNDGIPTAINKVIGLMQLAGSGIAIIVVTLLGTKYILASPADKADVKKAIMPIIIGCFLLFGGVNIAAMIADFSNKVMNK